MQRVQPLPSTSRVRVQEISSRVQVRVPPCGTRVRVRVGLRHFGTRVWIRVPSSRTRVRTRVLRPPIPKYTCKFFLHVQIRQGTSGSREGKILLQDLQVTSLLTYWRNCVTIYFTLYVTRVRIKESQSR